MQDTVWLDEEKDLLCYIDQTLLPNELKICTCNNIFDLYDIIKRLSIRGAPAIGVGAAMVFMRRRAVLRTKARTVFFTPSARAQKLSTPRARPPLTFPGR